MQMRLDGRAYPVADGSIVLARYENYGHLLLWPDEKSYRVLPTGSLAALMREGRPDVTPLMGVEAAPQPGADHLSRSTRVWRFETKRGNLELAQAEVSDAGFGGALLCRFLLEWLSVAPTALACEENSVPLRAEMVTGNGGRLVFAVTKLETRSDTLTSSLIQLPPRDASYRKHGLPRPGPLLSDVDLSALKPSDTTGVITTYNNTELLAYLLLDGTPVALIPPYAAEDLSGISSGRYQADLVDFLGEPLLPRTPLQVDRWASFGKANAGPDAGTDP